MQFATKLNMLICIGVVWLDVALFSGECSMYRTLRRVLKYGLLLAGGLIRLEW